MARAKAKRNLSANGMSIPEWGLVKKDIKPFKNSSGVLMDYKRLFQSAMYYVHYEVPSKALYDSFIMSFCITSIFFAILIYFSCLFLF